MNNFVILDTEEVFVEIYKNSNVKKFVWDKTKSQLQIDVGNSIVRFGEDDISMPVEDFITALRNFISDSPKTKTTQTKK